MIVLAGIVLLARATALFSAETPPDVRSQPTLDAVVALGASIVAGTALPHPVHARWTDRLAERFAAAGLPIAVINKGIPGNRLLTDGYGPSAEARFEHDVLFQDGVRWVIFSDAPLNDLGLANLPASAIHAVSAPALIDGIKRLIARAHSNRIQFFCSTMTPYRGASYWTPSGEAAREEINAFIRSSDNGCDGIVDQDAATQDPSDPTRFLPAYDSGDHLHPNEAGQDAIALAIDLRFFSTFVGVKH